VDGERESATRTRRCGSYRATRTNPDRTYRTYRSPEPAYKSYRSYTSYSFFVAAGRQSPYCSFTV
jgi:hypothetical protein